jgi:hypothetical protein
MGLLCQRTLEVHIELSNSPVCVNTDNLRAREDGVGLVLVLDIQTSDSGNQILRERQVVVLLRLRVDVLDNDIDRLARVLLLQVDSSYKIGVLEDLRRLEETTEHLLGNIRVAEVGLGVYEGQQRRGAACEQTRSPHSDYLGW